MSDPSVSKVAAILNHDRVATSWVVRAVLVDGKPLIERIARIARVSPLDGIGRMRVAVTDWSVGKGQDPRQFVTHASGCGYDKRAAALAGCTVGGFELGDHCDPDNKPTLDVLCRREGWEVIGAF